MQDTNGQKLVRRPSTWKNPLVGIVLIVVMSIVYFYLLMQPPIMDLGLMTLLLSTTAAISALLGFLIYRLGWMEHFPAVRWTLLTGYILSGLLTFFNVYVTAELMFTDQHDFLLATVLLVFSTAIAVVIGYFVSNTMVDRLSKLQRSAELIAEGDFTIRTDIPGRDEVAQLANTFNLMTEQLQQAELKQIEAENLRRELIAWVSHDLQTPLSSIQAMVEALKDGIVTDETTKQRYFLNIQREVHALSALIDDLFQLAQFDAGGLVLDIGSDSFIELTQDVVSSLSEIAAQRNIELRVLVDKKIGPIPMDSLLIGRVLNNLISNALHHTPSGGKIEISAQITDAILTVSVSDTGRGISQEDLPYIFDRFFRGEKSRSRSTGGAGLGLAIAKGIVEAHGGTIQAASNPNVGTNIQFTLPTLHKNN